MNKNISGEELCKIVLTANKECLALFKQTFGFKYLRGYRENSDSHIDWNRTVSDWESSYEGLIKLSEDLNNLDLVKKQDPIYYLAAGYVNELLSSSKALYEENKKSIARERLIKNYLVYLQDPTPCKEFWYLSLSQIYEVLGEAYEKEFDFANAIKYFDLFDKKEIKQYIKTVASYRKEGGKNIKYLSYVRKGSGMLVDPKSRGCHIYLKMGTQYAIDYWKEQMDSPFYEEDSYFKICVDKELADILVKHDKGYKYLPKENKEKFKEIAIRNGWR